MNLSTFFLQKKMQVQKVHVIVLQKFSYKYMQVTYQLELWYFQVDESLACMDMDWNFHILIIIYQSFNVKVFWNFRTTNQFRTYFSSSKFLKMYVQLTMNSMKCSMISKCNLNRFLIFFLLLTLKRYCFKILKIRTIFLAYFIMLGP
jgi:hypothetical protein